MPNALQVLSDLLTHIGRSRQHTPLLVKPSLSKGGESVMWTHLLKSACATHQVLPW